MGQVMKRFIRDESGATAAEYGLIAAAIAAVIVVVIVALAARSPTASTRSTTGSRPMRDLTVSATWRP